MYIRRSVFDVSTPSGLVLTGAVKERQLLETVSLNDYGLLDLVFEDYDDEDGSCCTSPEDKIQFLIVDAFHLFVPRREHGDVEQFFYMDNGLEFFDMECIRVLDSLRAGFHKWTGGHIRMCRGENSVFGTPSDDSSGISVDILEGGPQAVIDFVFNPYANFLIPEGDM